MAKAAGMDEPRKPQGSLPLPKSKRGVKGFFSEVSREMKKVSWPSKAETNRLTSVVLGVCLLVVVVLTSLSWVFQSLVSLITRGTI